MGNFQDRSRPYSRPCSRPYEGRRREPSYKYGGRGRHEPSYGRRRCEPNYTDYGGRRRNQDYFDGDKKVDTFQRVSHVEGTPTDKKWYHAAISDREAERRLRQGGQDTEGAFIVYDNPRSPGNYVLIATTKNNQIYRWRITRRKSDNLFVLGEDGPGSQGYPSVRELIKDHRGFTGRRLKTDHGITLKLNANYNIEYVGD